LTTAPGSVWRSAFGRAALAWMALAVVTLLAFATLADLLPFQVLQWTMIAIFMAAPAALVLWSAWAIFKAPRRTLPVFLVLMVFSGGLLLAGGQVILAGARTKFVVHRATYEAVVADVRSGRVPRDAGGCFRGRRGGMDFSSFSCGSEEVIFPWGDDALTLYGVIYDPYGCPPPKPVTRPPKPTPPLINPETGLEMDPPSIPNGGLIGRRWPIAGRYCVIWAIF
jgi:hypothetical protein